MLMGYIGSLHSITHNLFGAIATVALCAVLWSWAQKQSWWGQGMPVLTRTALFNTAWWAVATHLLLDVMSHADIPYSASKWFGIEEAEQISVFFGVLGLVLLAIRWLIAKIIGGVLALRTKARQG